jgi:hypothetical protein
MATTKEKRRANRARRIIRSESRWLQKAIFALSKAEEARTKLADLYDDDAEEFTVEVNGKDQDVGELGTLLRKAVEERLQKQREELRERMKIR